MQFKIADNVNGIRKAQREEEIRMILGDPTRRRFRVTIEAFDAKKPEEVIAVSDPIPEDSAPNQIFAAFLSTHGGTTRFGVESHASRDVLEFIVRYISEEQLGVLWRHYQMMKMEQQLRQRAAMSQKGVAPATAEEMQRLPPPPGSKS